MKKVLLAAVVSVFASQAQAGVPACLFGSDISEIEQNSRLSVKDDVIKTFKMSRGEEDSSLVMVSVAVIKDKKTKREFHMNTTFRHKDDGDNTRGWIEEVTGSADADSGVKNEGAVVAMIGDSEIYECTILK